MLPDRIFLEHNLCCTRDWKEKFLEMMEVLLLFARRLSRKQRCRLTRCDADGTPSYFISALRGQLASSSLISIRLEA
jgi:hypothetical protein